ncbi:hypothetical protein [Capnocytophaga gingivalis]|uniref:Uncharacterized protein n=1 Tax=Capnocytophaga gingivalis TaxID=1017 RepID=A0ABU5ZAB1_9FLAO|nr:hypothetical protein [Capnocytophaga gingivalis]MEB3075884.1 hypothetical protein [Capnocytophaga gingivalis]
MELKLITAIAEGDFSAILNITSQLTDSERYETIAAIRVLDPYSEKDFPRKNVAKKMVITITIWYLKLLITPLSLWCAKKVICLK